MRSIKWCMNLDIELRRCTLMLRLLVEYSPTDGIEDWCVVKAEYDTDELGTVGVARKEALRRITVALHGKRWRNRIERAIGEEVVRRMELGYSRVPIVIERERAKCK